MSRLTILSEVVLPQPDGPTRTQILPAGTVRVRSLTAPGAPNRRVASSKCFVTWTNSTVLAAYYARSAQGPEFEQGTKLFEEIIAKTQRKSFTALYNYAARVLCGKSDRAGYEKVMKEIIDAGDLDENRRLTNNISRIKAKRDLSMERMMDCGFDMSQPAAK